MPLSAPSIPYCTPSPLPPLLHTFLPPSLPPTLPSSLHTFLPPSLSHCTQQPNSTGEQKTKPTQHSVRQLRGLGLTPDLVTSINSFQLQCKMDISRAIFTNGCLSLPYQIACRSQLPIVESVRSKISNFCHVKPEQVRRIYFDSLNKI